MEILIIKLGAMGDVMRMTSILKPLKEKYRGAKITWVTKKGSVDLLRGNPYIDAIITIGDAQSGAFRGKVFGLVLSFDDEEEACGLASDVKSKKIIGAYLKDGKRLYTKEAAEWFDMGLISAYGKKEADKKKIANKKTYQQIHFDALGLTADPKKYPPILNLGKEELAFAEKFARKHGLSKKEKVVGINTGAGGRWQDKRLSVEQTIELIDRVHSKTKAKVILFGGPEEEERNAKILKGVKSPIIDAGCKNPVREFAALIGLCDLLITSDSLAMHIGVALGKKVVVFFGPTSSSEIELYRKGAKIIPKVGCLCCYKPKCDIPPKYDVSEIAEAAIRLLK